MCPKGTAYTATRRHSVLSAQPNTPYTALNYPPTYKCPRGTHYTRLHHHGSHCARNQLDSAYRTVCNCRHVFHPGTCLKRSLRTTPDHGVTDTVQQRSPCMWPALLRLGRIQLHRANTHHDHHGAGIDPARTPRTEHCCPRKQRSGRRHMGRTHGHLKQWVPSTLCNLLGMLFVDGTRGRYAYRVQHSATLVLCILSSQHIHDHDVLPQLWFPTARLHMS